MPNVAHLSVCKSENDCNSLAVIMLVCKSTNNCLNLVLICASAASEALDLIRWVAAHAARA